MIYLPLFHSVQKHIIMPSATFKKVKDLLWVALLFYRNWSTIILKPLILEGIHLLKHLLLANVWSNLFLVLHRSAWMGNAAQDKEAFSDWMLFTCQIVCLGTVGTVPSSERYVLAWLFKRSQLSCIDFICFEREPLYVQLNWYVKVIFLSLDPKTRQKKSILSHLNTTIMS